MALDPNALAFLLFPDRIYKMAQIRIQQSPLSGIAQALAAGVSGYRQGQQAREQENKQNALFQFEQQESQRKQAEFDRKNQARESMMSHRDQLPGYLSTINQYNSGGDVSVGDYSGAQAGLLNAFDSKNAKSIAEALGQLQRQRMRSQGVSAVDSGNMGIADALMAGAADAVLPDRYSTNAQGLTTNNLTGQVSITAPNLHHSIVGQNNAGAMRDRAEATNTNARTGPEVALLEAQTADALRPNIQKTTMQKDLIAAGYVEGTPEFQTEMRNMMSRLDPQDQ